MKRIGYILPDGQFYNIIEEGYKTHAHYEKSLARHITNEKKWIRINDGSNVRGEHIVELPIEPITTEQYESLLEFLDYMLYSNKEFIDVGIEEHSSGTKFSKNALWFKHYEFKDHLPDDIIKEIKQQYNRMNNIAV